MIGGAGLEHIEQGRQQQADDNQKRDIFADAIIHGDTPFFLDTPQSQGWGRGSQTTIITRLAKHIVKDGGFSMTAGNGL